MRVIPRNATYWHLSFERELERYVDEYGERYRPLIKSALNFLATNPTFRHLSEPFNVDAYIADLIAKCVKL